MARLQEIEAEIIQLKAEESLEWGRQEAQREIEKKERQRQEKLALERQSVESKRRQESYYQNLELERKAAEVREKRESQRRYDATVAMLPSLEDMPVCAVCGSRMWFGEIPPRMKYHDTFLGTVSTTTLVCPSCGRRVTAKFQSPFAAVVFE